MKRKNIGVFILLFLFVLPLSVMAQSGTVQGVVLDESGEAIIGASVVIEGTSLGTVTEFDGSYTIEEVSVGEVSITVSYVGYEDKTQTITVVEGESVTLDFTIGEDVELLNEVVVVGYGTQRRRDLVGNVVKINSEDMMEQVGATFETGLQGKASGVNIVQGSGAAGSSTVINIRGVSSISAGGGPLFVVDGIIVSQDNYLLGASGGLNNNPLSSLNPDDIENIEILKDASAAAIYGSRAAGGVIIITTKRGKSGKPRFNYTTSLGFARPTNVLGVLDASEWVAVQQEAWENSGNVGRFPLPNGLSYDDIEGVNTDWIDRVIRTGIKQEHNLSMRAGNKWLSAYVGLSYSKNESYLLNNDFRRTAGRINLDITPTEKFKISISSSVARGLRNKSQQAWAGGLGLAQSTALPIYPINNADFPVDSPLYNEEGYYNIYNNPIAQSELTDLVTREWRYLNNLQLSYMPTDRLTFTVQGNYDFTHIGDYTLEDEQWTTTTHISKASVFKINNRGMYGTAQYDFLKGNETHSLNGIVGMEYQQYNSSNIYAEDNRFDGQFYEVKEYRELLDSLNFGDLDGYKFLSYFARVTYDFKKKYFVQAVYRRDGSSKFGANNRFGDFPSIGLGYIISEEDFFPQNKVLNYLKLKTSWGVTGNANIPWTEQFATFAFNNNPGTINNGLNYNGNDVQFQIKEANPNLKWETVQSYDVGLEFGWFDDRLTTNLTYYYKLTKDALLREFLAASSGYNEFQFFKNVGKIRNQGVEFELRSNNLKGNKLSWITEFNIAANRNKVLDVGNATPDALDGGFGDTRVIEGQPIGVNFIVMFSHVDPDTGRPVYLDADGNETFEYNPATMRQVAGNIQADFIGSLTNKFSYKNFDFSFMFYFSKGGTIYDDAAKRQLGVITPDWNYTYGVFDRWREPGDIADIPRFATSMLEWGGSGNVWQNNHSLWLYDASYLRLRNITFAYNLKPKNTKAFKNVRFFASGINLLTFTKYPGWDPEIARDRNQEQERNVGGTNVTYLTPPQEKSFNFGVSLDF